MTHHRPLAALLTLPLAFALLTGCATTNESPDNTSADNGYLTFADVQDEYRTTVTGFPYELPSGVDFPAEPRKPAQEAMFQKGAGLAQAYQFWECAWMDEFLQSQDTEQAAADDALTTLEKGASSPYRTQDFEDPNQTWTTTVIGQARLGDSSVLSDFYQSDCTWYREETGQ